MGVQPVGIGLGEIMQHIICDRVFVARMTDAKTHTAVAFADMAMDRPQAVVPGMATSHFDAQFTGGKVQLVMKHHNIGGESFMKCHGRLNRLAGQVHEGFGFEQ